MELVFLFALLCFVAFANGRNEKREKQINKKQIKHLALLKDSETQDARRSLPSPASPSSKPSLSTCA